MAQMKAILVNEGNGGIGSLAIGETDLPKPSSQEVLVKIKAFGLNRSDIHLRDSFRSATPHTSRILGLEFSGVITEIGSEASTWKGAYAEYIAVPETHIIKKPTDLSWVDAAAIPENWFTAFQALVKIGNIKAGDDVLVHTGASGVGLAGIQMARLCGAKNVLTTASTRDKLDFVLNLPDGGASATHAINYKTEDFSEVVANVTGGKGVDVLVDFVGQSHWHKNLNSLAVDGRMILLATLSGSKVDNVDLAQILFKRLHIEGSTLHTRSNEYKTKLISEFQDQMWNNLACGRLKVYIHKIYPWTEIQEAHREMEENKNM